MSKQVIAIDGPAGAGKSTVAKAIAAKLGFTYLDTGAMYRAVGLLATRAGVSDAEGAGVIAGQMDLRFEPTASGQRLIVNGEDVTDLIRTPAIGEAASNLSAFSGVRRPLVRRQKELIEAESIVLEGRDTTTVVCPEAKLKVFLTASVTERARRHFLEYSGTPNAPSLEEIEKSITERDHRDSTREDSPLQIAEDAVVVDSDLLTPDEVVEVILAEWSKR
ncbi:MAG: (d)CMP kinase [Fimbriimonadales bacterium]